MSSLTNINNNSSVINVGRTTPVNPGARPGNESIPVVLATDQQPIPVIEQQKIQSEVAISMLGIPRGEVALGIFSDVNTYDVNPSEWSSVPAEYTTGYGIKHLPQEAGALIQAPKDKIAILSSKRFFRYQPGRVSAATFGVKASKSPSPVPEPEEGPPVYDLNPAIRKYGIFDKFDGYYWESRSDGFGDNFAVVRRTQSLINLNSVEFSNEAFKQQDDYRISGKAASDPNEGSNEEVTAIEIIRDQLFDIIDTAYNGAVAFFTTGAGANPESLTHLTLIDLANNINYVVKCKRDTEFALNAYMYDLQYTGRGHTMVNATTYRTAIGPAAAITATTNARRNAENKLHELIGTELKTRLGNVATFNIINLNGIALNTRIDGLVNITRAAVGLGGTLGVQPTTADLTSTSTAIWGRRNKIKTVFSIYKRYLGYLISKAFIPVTGYTAALEYKCLRDVGYVVEGYAKDLVGGGNSATVYNMKNFYFNNVLQVYTEFADNYSAIQFHIDAHTILRTLIAKNGNISDTEDNPNTARWNLDTIINAKSTSDGITIVTGWTSVLNLFNLGSLRIRMQNGTTGLADELIRNFTFDTRYMGRLESGSESQYGDLVVLRDGLIHIHAGVYDPSLLKETKQVRVKIDVDANTLHVAEGEFVVGQTINFVSTLVDQVPGGLVSDKFYAVRTISGPLNNIITLYDISDPSEAEINITSISTDPNTKYYIEPNVPFVFPNEYQKGNVSTVNGERFRVNDGMFPFLYAGDGIEPFPYDGNLPKNSTANSVGYIDTAISTTSADYELLRSQIDFVNYKYNNWVKQNVDPKYYAVYEYRVPRSRFSTDKLDGNKRKVVYSDVASGEITGIGATKVRPGQNVSKDGINLEATSVWDIDLTKVTMLKIEFSWYGAVGALFLAYVPVSNGEARWVRVHHLRASNQLKISSLGNATLPITYLTYGGGSVNKYGILDDVPKSYGSSSDHIVKYGASYYIDGGDRGTVRLYSHTNIVPTKVYGRTYPLAGNITISPAGSGTPADPTGYPYITVPDYPDIAKTFFMKAQVVTNSVQDQNIQVIWVDGNKLYLNKELANTISTDVRLIAKRPSVSFGLKAKQNIFNSEGTGIRNRVQVYPTKLSTANFETVPIALDILKSPVFQTATPVTGSFTLSADYIVTPDNSALTTANTGYLKNDGEETYGWFLANVGTVFGRLYKQNNVYYFELREVYSEDVIILAGATFLKDGRFGFNGVTITADEYESTSQKERLSSVFISNVTQSPIPDTGSVVTSFFLSPGSNQFDLLSYFDYNKDYLSFPLTDEVESIYLSGSLSGNSNVIGELNTSITWEEQ